MCSITLHRICQENGNWPVVSGIAFIAFLYIGVTRAVVQDFGSLPVVYDTLGKAIKHPMSILLKVPST